MSCYKHYSIEERESLAKYIAQGKKQSEIAKIMKRNKSTISRELKRNKKEEEGYSPTQAEKEYQKRREKCGRKAILENKEKAKEVRKKILEKKWSPEQISNRIKMEKNIKISYGTIYRGIKEGRLNIEGEKKTKNKYPMERKLRRKGKKGLKEETRGRIKITNRIEERPEEAEKRSRLGDWEADTVCGKKSGECLVTFVDRKSRFLLAKKSEKQLDRYVREVMVELLKPYVKTNKLRTITPDRGKEFSSHEWVTKELNNVPFYFANPHSPWERGSNENTNGLIREYIPKRTDISLFSDEDIASMVNEINFRPRKCLGWKCPFEVFFNVSLHLI